MDGGYGGIAILVERISALERRVSRVHLKIDALAEALGKTMELVPEKYEVRAIEQKEEEAKTEAIPAEY